jgi:caffeoyl-CoA O-methyltransferase
MTIPSNDANTILEFLINYLQIAIALAEVESGSAELKKYLGQAKDLAVGLNSYATKYSAKPSAELQAIASATQIQPWAQWYQEQKIKNPLKPRMQSSSFQAQLLKCLVQITKSKRVLEIGMFTGYATLAIAEALPKDGRIIACERDPFVVELAQKLLENSTHFTKIEMRLGDGREILKHLIGEGQTFDLIFLDANKKAYLEYYQLILDGNLLNAQGLLCVDNTLFKGEVFTPKPKSIAQAIAEFNQVVATDERVEQIILPIEDGFSLIRLVHKVISTNKVTYPELFINSGM